MNIKLIEAHHCFNGMQKIFSHHSDITHCEMKFAIFIPPQTKKHPVPVLYWLSGLTCNEQNFIMKAGAQRLAAELGLIIVCPDTSPRGVPIAGDHDTIEFGLGAGFYVDATESPWQQNYQMSSYVSQELYTLISQHFPVKENACGIFGHSMGGHGALTLDFKNPEKYQSVSAMAPICAPMETKIGQYAFKNYLGENQQNWKKYDATQLILEGAWTNKTILIDQGDADPHLQEWLRPDLLLEAGKQSGINIDFNWQKNYDHSFYFINTFIDKHLIYHEKILSVV